MKEFHENMWLLTYTRVNPVRVVTWIQLSWMILCSPSTRRKLLGQSLNRSHLHPREAFIISCSISFLAAYHNNSDNNGYLADLKPKDCYDLHLQMFGCCCWCAQACAGSDLLGEGVDGSRQCARWQLTSASLAKREVATAWSAVWTLWCRLGCYWNEESWGMSFNGWGCAINHLRLSSRTYIPPTLVFELYYCLNLSSLLTLWNALFLSPIC